MINDSLQLIKSVGTTTFKLTTLILPTKAETNSIKWLWNNKSDLYEGAKGTNENLYINWSGVMFKVVIPATAGVVKIAALTFIPFFMDDRVKNSLYGKLGWLKKPSEWTEIRIDNLKLNLKVSHQDQFLNMVQKAYNDGIISSYYYEKILTEQPRTIWQKSYSLAENIWYSIKQSFYVMSSVHKFLNAPFELPTFKDVLDYTSIFIKAVPDYFKWSQKQLYTPDNTIKLNSNKKLVFEQIKFLGSKEFTDNLDTTSQNSLKSMLRDMIVLPESKQYNYLIDNIHSDLNDEIHGKITLDASFVNHNQYESYMANRSDSPFDQNISSDDEDEDDISDTKEQLEEKMDVEQDNHNETNLNDLIVNLQRTASESKRSLDEAAQSVRSMSLSAESIRETIKEEVKNAVHETVTNLIDDTKQNVIDRVSSFKESFLGKGRSYSVSDVENHPFDQLQNVESIKDTNSYLSKDFEKNIAEATLTQMRENWHVEDTMNDWIKENYPEVTYPSLLKVQSYTPNYIHKPIQSSNLINKAKIAKPIELKSAFWNKSVRFDNESNEWKLSPQEVYEKFIRDCVDYSDDTKKDDDESDQQINYGKLFWNQIRDMNFSPVRNMYKFNVPMNEVKPIKGVELNREGNEAESFKIVKSVFSTDDSFLKLINATRSIHVKSLALTERIGDANMYKTAMFGRNLIDNNNVTDYRQLFDPLLDNISFPVNEVLNHVKSLSSYMNDLSSLDSTNIAFPNAQEAMEKLNIDIHYLIGKAYLINDLNNCLQLKHKYLQLISCYRDQFDVERWDDLMAEINPQSYSEDDLTSLNSGLLKDYDSIVETDIITVFNTDLEVIF